MIPPEQVLLRLAVAAGLGSIVGMERERVESSAGLRTHALVCLGSALGMIVSSYGFADVLGTPSVSFDPSRVAAQVISGIGFLGAGVIIFRREIIRGLTTAASIWVVAAVGLAVGGGLFVAALLTSLLCLAILAVMKPLERRFNASRRRIVVALVIDRRRIAAHEIESMLAAKGLPVDRLEIRLGGDPGKDKIEFMLRSPASTEIFAALEHLADEPGIREVRYAADGTLRRAPLSDEMSSGDHNVNVAPVAKEFSRSKKAKRNAETGRT